VHFTFGATIMASITIRNLDDEVKTGLRVRAANNGRSMEEEVRLILRTAVETEAIPAKGLGTAIHELFKPLGGVQLQVPQREPMREPPRFA
jgi:plasmid stability protein